jgi:hypothetical protein
LEVKRDEAEYLTAITNLGCIACRKEGRGSVPAEVHHPRHGTGLALKAPHKKSVPLCPAHHRGTDHPNTASIHLSPKVFVAKYGSEISLWHEVQGLLNQSISEDF